MRHLTVLVVAFALLPMAFGQEPNRKRMGIRQEALRPPSEQIFTQGFLHKPAPLLQPKALPVLNPPMGDIARQARITHAATLKAEMVFEEDTLRKIAPDGTTSSHPPYE